MEELSRPVAIKQRLKQQQSVDPLGGDNFLFKLFPGTREVASQIDCSINQWLMDLCDAVSAYKCDKGGDKIN